MQIRSRSVEETQNLASELLKKYSDIKVWLLHGNLAAGKTQFVKGIAKALGFEPNSVKSPTFVYLTEYPNFVHYDLYRLSAMDPLLLEQIQEHLESGRLIFIEWPELVEAQLQVPSLKLFFEHVAEDERLIEVVPPAKVSDGLSI